MTVRRRAPAAAAAVCCCCGAWPAPVRLRRDDRRNPYCGPCAGALLEADRAATAPTGGAP